MEFVEPIRDRKKLEAMKRYLKKRSLRDYAMFVFAINSALRISDVLKMRIGDIVDDSGRIKTHYELRERKTRKAKRFAIAPNARKAIKEYLDSLGDWNRDDYLFRSRKGANRPITRHRAYGIIAEAARACGVTERIGSHSCRKTWAYHAYKNGVDLAIIQSALNHSSQRETLRYIGIRGDEIDDVYVSLNL